MRSLGLCGHVAHSRLGVCLPASPLPGNASKVSRQQAFIQRTAEGNFYIRNIGARPRSPSVWCASKNGFPVSAVSDTHPPSLPLHVAPAPGRRPIIVNNFAVEKGMRVRLPEEAFMEVGGIRMLFLPNRSLFPSSHGNKDQPAGAARPPPVARRRTPSVLGGEAFLSPRQLAPPLAGPPSAQQLALQAQQAAALDAAEAALRPHLPEAQASSADLAAQQNAKAEGGEGDAAEAAAAAGAGGAVAAAAGEEGGPAAPAAAAAMDTS